MSQRHARTPPASRQTGRFCDRGLDCMLNLAIDTAIRQCYVLYPISAAFRCLVSACWSIVTPTRSPCWRPGAGRPARLHPCRSAGRLHAILASLGLLPAKLTLASGVTTCLSHGRPRDCSYALSCRVTSCFPSPARSSHLALSGLHSRSPDSLPGEAIASDSRVSPP